MIKTFEKVWYLPDVNRWRDLNILAFRDVGTLTLDDNLIIFEGKKGKVEIRNVKRVSIGKQGRDFVNDWVKVEYEEGSNPLTAFFADGTRLGWSGMFGGTKKILAEIENFIKK
jgi:hypothetical protein